MELISIYAGSLIAAAVSGFLAGRARRTSEPSPAMRRACRLLRGNCYAPIAHSTRRALLRRQLATDGITQGFPGALVLTAAGGRLAR